MNKQYREFHDLTCHEGVVAAYRSVTISSPWKNDSAIQWQLGDYLHAQRAWFYTVFYMGSGSAMRPSQGNPGQTPTSA
jgi:hypothetical protein